MLVGQLDDPKVVKDFEIQNTIYQLIGKVDDEISTLTSGGWNSFCSMLGDDIP